MDSSVGLVIPAYNPDPDILRTYITDLSEILDPDRIHIELDGASTFDASGLNATVNHSPERRGKGAAIVDGFEHLSRHVDILVFADADGSTPAESLTGILDSLHRTHADLGVGSRRHPDATIQSHQSILRRRLGDTFAWTARRLLTIPLYDYQCGAKAITTEAWQQVRTHLYERGFAWDLELLAVADALELSIAEVPVTWNDHPESTVDPLRSSLSMLRALFSVRHRAETIKGSRLHTALNRDRPTIIADD